MFRTSRGGAVESSGWGSRGGPAALSIEGPTSEADPASSYSYYTDDEAEEGVPTPRAEAEAAQTSSSGSDSLSPTSPAAPVTQHDEGDSSGEEGSTSLTKAGRPPHPRRRPRH